MAKHGKPKNDGRVGQLRQKYGAVAMDNAARLHPDEDVYEMMEWRDDMDPHYAKLWLDWTYGGLYTRTILSDRVRILVVIGQCIALDELEELPIHIRSALAHHATPREVLEVILQLTVYITRKASSCSTASIRTSPTPGWTGFTPGCIRAEFWITRRGN